MSKLGISTGTTPNDGTGDTLLQGAVKVNSNFDEVYTFLGDGSSLTTIDNNKLTNSTVSYGGVQLSLGTADATPAFDLSDATNYPYSSLTGITTEIVGDTSPRLGGNLNLNSNDITGTGNVNITGSVTATSFSGSGSNITGISTLNITNYGVGFGNTNTLQSRTIVSGSTTSIANNGIGNTDITGFKSYSLMKVGLSTEGWLRIYTDSVSRDTDVSRSVGEDPLPGSGVIAEVVTTGISTTQIISPFVTGGNLDEPETTTIYVSIKNLSGSTQAITANLTILQLEA